VPQPADRRTGGARRSVIALSTTLCVPAEPPEFQIDRRVAVLGPDARTEGWSPQPFWSNPWASFLPGLRKLSSRRSVIIR